MNETATTDIYTYLPTLSLHDALPILHAGTGARAEGRSQESILFDRALLVRDTQVRIAGDADFLGVEAVVLGRAAMDEVVARGTLVDRWRIWRDGRLIYADAPKLDGPIDTLMQYPAIGAGARAMAVEIGRASCRRRGGTYG